MPIQTRPMRYVAMNAPQTARLCQVAPPTGLSRNRAGTPMSAASRPAAIRPRTMISPSEEPVPGHPPQDTEGRILSQDTHGP